MLDGTHDGTHGRWRERKSGPRSPNPKAQSTCYGVARRNLPSRGYAFSAVFWSARAVTPRSSMDTAIDGNAGRVGNGMTTVRSLIKREEKANADQ